MIKTKITHNLIWLIFYPLGQNLDQSIVKIVEVIAKKRRFSNLLILINFSFKTIKISLKHLSHNNEKNIVVSLIFILIKYISYII